MSLTANERFSRSAFGPDVSRPSLYTTKSSLPGRYSHRSRTLEERVWAPAFSWTRLLTNRRGVGVTVKRVVTTLAVKSQTASFSTLRRTRISVRDIRRFSISWPGPFSAGPRFSGGAK